MVSSHYFHFVQKLSINLVVKQILVEDKDRIKEVDRGTGLSSLCDNNPVPLSTSSAGGNYGVWKVALDDL